MVLTLEQGFKGFIKGGKGRGSRMLSRRSTAYKGTKAVEGEGDSGKNNVSGPRCVKYLHTVTCVMHTARLEVGIRFHISHMSRRRLREVNEIV